MKNTVTDSSTGAALFFFFWLDAGLRDTWSASSPDVIHNVLSSNHLTQSWLSRLSIVKANDETSFLLTVNHTFSYISPL